MKGEHSLRWQVEDILGADDDKYATIPPEDVQSLMRQLQIQQIALELENKELRELHGRLREKRDHYRRLFERFPSCCVVLDASQTVRAANEPAASVLQCHLPELIGTNWRELIHPDDLDQWDLQLQQPLGNKDAEELNVRIAVKGELISDRCWCCQTRNDTGELESVLLVLPVHQNSTSDSEISEARSHCEAAEERFRLTAEVSRDAVIGVTLDGTVETWNPAAEQMLGVDAETATGTSILQLARSVGWSEAKQLYTSICHRTSITEYPAQIQTEDGRLLDVIVNSHPVRNAAGHATGALMVIRSAAPQVRTSSDLLQMDSDSRQTSRITSMGQLIAMLAHELSQPLTVIAGCADACDDWMKQKDPSQEDLQNNVQRLHQQSQRATSTIRSLRRFATRSALAGSAIDLNEEIEEVCGLLKSQIDVHGTTVHLNLSESLPMVRADFLHIQQVIVSFLRASLQAMKQVDSSNRRIVISTDILPEDLRVSVRHNGQAISDDDAEQLFGRRFSADRENRETELANCDRIIRGHNGTLNAHRNADSTTTFEFTLPRTDKQPQQLSRC